MIRSFPTLTGSLPFSRRRRVSYLSNNYTQTHFGSAALSLHSAVHSITCIVLLLKAETKMSISELLLLLRVCFRSLWVCCRQVHIHCAGHSNTWCPSYMHVQTSFQSGCAGCRCFVPVIYVKSCMIEISISGYLSFSCESASSLTLSSSS